MKNIRDFHAALHLWYASHGRRGLPWRNTKDSYAIYISEIMLQQTQVKTVLERFYHPFLAKFPTLQALADAPRDSVLKAWEGLGYYSRANNLHEAAKSVAPVLPASVEGLLALPGIGRNTAHAVAAFAHQFPVPVMEANVKRVLCRIFALENPSADALWTRAEALLDKANPYDYNQAMMDIGALICTKRAPKCILCPASIICDGKAAPEKYPASPVKKAPPIRRARFIVQRDASRRYRLLKRESAFLKGLYGFPEYTGAELPPQAIKLGDVTQVYSHFRMEGEVWFMQLGEEGEGWFAPEEITKLALSGIDHKIWKLAVQAAS